MSRKSPSLTSTGPAEPRSVLAARSARPTSLSSTTGLSALSAAIDSTHQTGGSPNPAAAGHIGHRRSVVEDFQHSLIALLHHVQLHRHNSGPPPNLQGSTPQQRRWPPSKRGPPGVRHLPGPLSPSYRGASRNCQPATEATLSTMNRVCTVTVPIAPTLSRQIRGSDSSATPARCRSGV